MRRLVAATPVAHTQAEELHKRATLLGYNVGWSIGVTLGTGAEPGITFHVWVVDQEHGDGQSFTTVDDVKEYLEHLASLPRYCPELVGNPRNEVEGGAFTVITDTGSGQTFNVKRWT